MERQILIRAAEQADLPALTALYNYYVLNSTATFDTEPFSVEQRQAWFDQFAETGPHRLLLAEQNDAALGYISSTRFRPKPAYSQSVETTVYLATDAARKGIGSALYQHLFAQLQREPVHRAYAVVALPNDASRALHLKFGFEPLHVLNEVGRKFDRYVDTEWFEKKLCY